MNILNNWKMLELRTRQGESLVCIEGRVYGSNPRFPTSSHIRTSPVTGYSMEANSMVITTRRGSEYLLGKPDQKQIFAQQRLMRRLSSLGQTSTPGFNELATEVTGFQDQQTQETPSEAQRS
ncbi:MAG: hypothetical protein KBE22_16590 [Candidatus Accumulibacter sp.]|nr:hypothetical protein [Accumulibacter sp.]